MARERGKPATARIGETNSAGSSRRRVLALMLGACRWLPGTVSVASVGASPAASAEPVNPAAIRMAISESLVSGVNLNDARAAMLIWIRQMEADLRLPLELNPNVFEPTAEIVRRARGGLFDAVALNIVEYRQIADVLDSSQIINETGGAEEYMLLVKRGSGIEKPADLRGRRLLMLTGPKMCVRIPLALDHSGCGASRPDRSVLRLRGGGCQGRAGRFAGIFRAGRCLPITSKRSFDVMCELNPQVAKGLTAIAVSAPMVLTFYTFHKSFKGGNRGTDSRTFIPPCLAPSRADNSPRSSNSGVWPSETPRAWSPALAVLDKAERIHASQKQPEAGREGRRDDRGELQAGDFEGGEDLGLPVRSVVVCRGEVWLRREQLAPRRQTPGRPESGADSRQ